MKEITCNITKPIAVLSENNRGYTKEANFVSWNERHPGHTRCGKGVTLTKDEGRRLWEALTGIYSRLGGKEGCE